MKNIFWKLSNIFGYIFGWPILSPIFKFFINLFLHGLGYDNMYRGSWTGEKWFIKKILRPYSPSVCLDIGANVGDYTKMLLQYTESKVYAVEPSSVAFTELSKFKNNRLTCIHSAVGDFNGKADLFYRVDGDQKASLDKDVNLGGKKESVNVLTIQNLVNNNKIEKVDYVKIDTEGFEMEVIRGLGDIKPKFIQFEFNLHHLFRNHTLFSLTQLLPQYEFYRLLPHGWIRIDVKKYVNNIFMFCNIIAVRK